MLARLCDEVLIQAQKFPTALIQSIREREREREGSLKVEFPKFTRVLVSFLQSYKSLCVCRFCFDRMMAQMCRYRREMLSPLVKGAFLLPPMVISLKSGISARANSPIPCAAFQPRHLLPNTSRRDKEQHCPKCDDWPQLQKHNSVMPVSWSRSLAFRSSANSSAAVGGH